MFEKLPRETGFITIMFNMDFIFYNHPETFACKEYDISYCEHGVIIEPIDLTKTKVFIPWHNIECITGEIRQDSKCLNE